MACYPSQWRTPVLAPMLSRRGTAAATGLIGLVQVGAGALGFHTFDCPMLQITGFPCPGCGASRACGAILRNDWHQSAEFHLFAPMFLLALALFVLAAVLPPGGRDALAGWVGRVERTTALAPVTLVALLVYWIARLLYAPQDFARLMHG